MTRTLGRLCQFGMARWSGTELAVRTALAPIPEHQLRRLSRELVGLHHCMLRQTTVRGVGAVDARAGSAQLSTLVAQASSEPTAHAGSMSL